MTNSRHRDPEWREFERLIARIEADAGPHGVTVTSPDWLRCKLTGRMREVDASFRAKVGTTEILVTIECRRRGKTQDVTWIEQLATKKSSIGADRTIAVSASGFSAEAQIAASHVAPIPGALRRGRRGYPKYGFGLASAEGAGSHFRSWKPRVM